MKTKKPDMFLFFISMGMQMILATGTYGQPVHNPEERYTDYGARANAFAGAYATEIHDATSMYWNPAAVAYLEELSILWDYYTDWNGRMRSGLIAAPIFTGNNSTVTLGATMGQLLIADEFETTHSVSSYGVDAAFAVRLTPTLSIGTFGSMRQFSMGKSVSEVFNSAIGLLYKPGPDISYGITYNGIGNIISYTFKDGRAVLQQVHAPKNLQVGLTMNFPSSKSGRDFSIALANDKTFGVTGIRYNAAVEWCVIHFLDLRMGYVVAQKYAGAKYGAGVKFGGMKADYALSPSSLTNRFQEFTLSFEL